MTFAKSVIRLCQELQSNPVNRELIGQVVRASGSIGANYREANDASSPKDFANRIRIVVREAKEANFWLKLLAVANHAPDGDLEALIQESLELRRIFGAMVRNHDRGI